MNRSTKWNCVSKYQIIGLRSFGSKLFNDKGLVIWTYVYTVYAYITCKHICVITGLYKIIYYIYIVQLQRYLFTL